MNFNKFQKEMFFHNFRNNGFRTSQCNKKHIETNNYLKFKFINSKFKVKYYSKYNFSYSHINCFCK